MGRINICNSKGRDAMVNTRSMRIPLRLKWLDQDNRPTKTVKILKASLDHDYDILKERFGESLSNALIEGDPEIDFEIFGSFLKNTSRVYINPERKIIHKASLLDIIKNPDGSERERKPHKTEAPNVATDSPLKWSGKMMPKEKVFNRFMFSLKLQITHYNGLTYDFLYAMAKDLEEKNSLMMLGAGPKSNRPLLFRRGGSAYRGFLEGRTQGNKYALILHLSNMELKKEK